MLGVLAFQGLCLWFLSARPQSVIPVRKGAEARVHSIAGSDGEQQVMAGLGTLEPALFAVAHERGFSAGTGRLPAPEPPIVETTLDSPTWLTIAAMAHPVEVTVQSLTAAVAGMTPVVERAAADFSSLRPLNTAPIQESVVSLEGALQQRPIVRGLPVPPLALSEIVQSSVVQVGVDPDGVPDSVRLLASSGAAVADREALRRARQLRFTPSRVASRFTWGNVVFAWRTQPPVSTNTVVP